MDKFVFMLVGVMMFYFAYAIGLKHKIDILHDYHYQNLEEANKNAYLKLMGIGVFIMGLGCLSSVLISLLWKGMYIVFFIGGMVLGIVVLLYAQYKYNGSIFSLTDKHDIT